VTNKPGISVVVPVLNEEANVALLADAVRNALPADWNWELLFVDDGSSDGTCNEIRLLAAADDRIRLVALARNYGQTTALQAGFDHARGDVVVSMDGDLQNDPADIPALVAKLAEGYDMVAGYRVRRQDAVLTRKVPSWIANRIVQRITGVPIRDHGCSLKAYRRALVQRMSLYSDLHRFIPAVAAGTAGARIVEVPVRHHARKRGVSKYGLSRVGKVLADLLTIMMIRSFREQPLALFAIGAVGAGALGVAFTVGAAVTYFGAGASFPTIVLPAVAALWFALSCYLLMLGLIAETALGNARLEDAEPSVIAHQLA
jgi:glycosyltransferase involved in cell wall biosynthesis